MFQKTYEIMTAHMKTANTAIHNKAKVEWQNSKKGKQPLDLFVFLFLSHNKNSIKKRERPSDSPILEINLHRKQANREKKQRVTYTFSRKEEKSLRDSGADGHTIAG